MKKESSKLLFHHQLADFTPYRLAGKVIIKFNDNHLESFKCKSKERASAREKEKIRKKKELKKEERIKKKKAIKRNRKKT